ncbi:hypothetical protein I3760_01G214500 [Carya illinoinensis]|nr:hypothetical protein I3760_01G214500 [Carya illinoinensis]
MAMAKEIMGGSLIQRSSFVSSSKVFLNPSFQKKQNHFFVNPLVVPLEKTRLVRLRKVVRGPVAAISEDLVKPVPVAVPADKGDKFKVRAVVTVRNKNKEDLKDKIVKHLDAITDKIGMNVVLQLVSTEIDPKTKAPKKSNEAILKDWSKKSNVKAERVNYTAEFMLNSSFGVPGAILVTNNHQKEFFLETITVEGFAGDPVHFFCNSWVQSRKDHPGKRIFFSNKPYLPSETPAGLRSLREKELRDTRGDGKGVRKLSDRIYDFDVYNDLGNPDRGIEFARPTLGGEKIPFPRRCRTGRLPSDTDMHAESRVEKPLPISRSKHVVTPPVDATTNWLWQLAKAHVCSNDAGVHQLVNHWLRTHASLEPFILAAHRQMSAMHPIFKLLDPHMRYTLEINGLARQSLINADGVIESCFTPGRYSMEISAAAYKSSWRFDMENLPADLIRRGVAVPDPTQPHGLKLLIEDYPYATDGLLIWSATENWVRTYVNYYYPESSLICNDNELQAWYSESVNVGHSDLRHKSWWPTLANADDLVSILTTLIWLASAQHAALNFGQYPYGGYVPNRPPLMRRLIPEENDPEYASFLADPQKYFLSALPSVLQTTKFMAVVDTLSTHSPDEEYLGERQQPSTWTGDTEVVEAFYQYSAEIQQIEKEIERRNLDASLRNRCGAGVLPYELLAPSSGPGVTCRGVPNSVSI